jgi:hypothetical protein
MKRYGLRDDQFARIENLLPCRPGTVGRNSDRGFAWFNRCRRVAKGFRKSHPKRTRFSPPRNAEGPRTLHRVFAAKKPLKIRAVFLANLRESLRFYARPAHAPKCAKISIRVR